MRQHRTEAKNKRRGNQSSSASLVEEIEACQSCSFLASIVRSKAGIFRSNEAIEALQAKVSYLKPTMTNSEISGLLLSLSKARVPQVTIHIQRAVMSTLAELALQRVHSFSAREIAITLNSLAKQQVRSDGLFKEAEKASLSIQGEFTCQNLATTVAAYSKMDLYSFDLFDMVARAAIPIIHTFNAHNLSTTVLAFAKMDHRNDELFAAGAKAAFPIIDTFQPQELSDTVKSFVKIGFNSPKLFRLVAKAAVPIIETFKADTLANIAGAFCSLGNLYHGFFATIATAAVPIIRTFNPQNLVMIVNAFASMEHRNKALLNAVAGAVVPFIRTFNASDLTMMINAFANLKCRQPTLFDAAAQAASAILDTFDSKELTTLIFAYSKARAFSELSDSLFAEVAGMLMIDNDSIATWEDSDLLKLAYIFKQAGLVNSKFVDMIASEVVSRGEPLSLDGRQLGTVAMSFEKYETPSCRRVLKIAFQGINITKLAETGLQGISEAVSAIPAGQRMGFLPLGFLQQVVHLAIEKSSDSRAEDVGHIVLSFSRVELDEQLYKELLTVYSPYFKQYTKQIEARTRSKICTIFQDHGITLE